MHQIEIEGFEGQRIEFKPAGFFGGPKLLVNGAPAEKGPKRGQMLLKKNDGTEVIATWQPVMMGLDTPRLLVAGEPVDLVKPMKWYEMVWSAIPIVLLFVGGLLGAIVGFIAFTINTRLFRSEMTPAAKYLLTGGVTAVAGIGFFVLAIGVYAVSGL